jgi:predicted nuclease with TOPRIM domain
MTNHQILKTLEKLNAELEEVQESIKTLDADVIDFREKLAKEGAA